MKSVKTWVQSGLQVSLLFLSVLLLASCGEDSTSSEKTAEDKEAAVQSQPDSSGAGSAMTGMGLVTQTDAVKSGADAVKNSAAAVLKEKNERLQKNLAKLGKGTGKSSCAAMSVKRCLFSDACVVEQGEDKQYACRDAANQCEAGFVQSVGDPKKTCEAKTDCTFVAASCFCPPGVTCVCGGGSPSACVARERG